MSSVLKETAWRAHLQLGFSCKTTGAKTQLSTRKHIGPLLVQKPFYPEGEACHIYLIHPPGGIVGGDLLHVDVDMDKHSHALITTPAATKFYRSNAKQAALQQQLRLATNSTLEWLPQESIFFSGSDANMTTHITMEADSQFIGWEILCLGRPASKELFTGGKMSQSFELWKKENSKRIPLFIERSEINGGSEMLSANWGMQNCTVTATMICAPMRNDKDIYEQLRAIECRDGLAAISRFEEGMVARYLGHNAIAAREYFAALWHIVRPVQINRQACEPRIWST